MASNGGQTITKNTLNKFLEDHKFYLSKQELDTLFSVLGSDGKSQVETLTPDDIKRAIEKSREQF